MKAAELRELSLEELNEKEKTLKKDLFNLNIQRKIGSLEKPANFRLLKRDIARILTILKEREMENGGKRKKKK